MKGILVSALLLIALLCTTSTVFAKLTLRSKQLTGLVNAIESYYTIYYDYPPIFDESGILKLNKNNNTENLMLALAAQDINFNKDTQYNKKGIAFYTFREWEFNSAQEFIDIYDNTNITIVLDTNNDGIVDLPKEAGGTSVKGRVHAYSQYDDGVLAISTWGSKNNVHREIVTEREKKRMIRIWSYRSIVIILILGAVVASTKMQALHVNIAIQSFIVIFFAVVYFSGKPISANDYPFITFLFPVIFLVSLILGIYSWVKKVKHAYIAVLTLIIILAIIFTLRISWSHYPYT